MKSIKRIFGIGCLMLGASAAWAQSDFGVWESLELSTKLNKQFELSVDGELRTQDNSSDFERFSAGVNLSYKNKKVPFLKASVGYVIMSMHSLEDTEIKYLEDDPTVPKHKNVDAPYWYTRHRATASLTGSVKWGRVKFALRERYQFTHRMAAQCDRERYGYHPVFDMWDEEPEILVDDKPAKNDHKLRSRLSVSYDIKKSKFEPFAEVEIYNQLDNAFAYDKIRYTIGTDYKISKDAKLSVYYRYQDYSDVSDINGHILGVGMSIEL